MNRTGRVPGSTGSRVPVSVALAAVFLLLAGCYRLDSFLFDPTRVDGYLRHEDIDIYPEWHTRWVIPDSMYEQVTLTSSTGNTIYGYFVRPMPDSSRAFENRVTVLYCNGNGNNINRYWGRVELLWEMGFQVFIFDYEGYGMSEGTPSGEACYADGRAALDYCLGRPDVDGRLLVIHGWSLGSWVAHYLAVDVLQDSLGQDYLALLLENPFASVSGVAKEGALLDVPGSYLVEADFDNERRIGRVERPMLLYYGDIDDTAVPERCAHVLIDIAERWHRDLTVRVIPGAGHSDIPEHMGFDEYRDMVRHFVDGCAGVTPR